MKIYIKYMVSIRCKMIVRTELESVGLIPTSVELGEVELIQELTVLHHSHLKIALFVLS